MVQRQRAIVENAARKLEAIAVRDGQMFDCRGRARIDDEHAIGVIATERQTGCGRSRQWSRFYRGSADLRAG